MKLIHVIVMAVLVVITGNFIDAEQCSDCANGCLMSSVDDCNNTCLQQVFCKNGEWTASTKKFCTLEECIVKIDNPLVDQRSFKYPPFETKRALKYEEADPRFLPFPENTPPQHIRPLRQKEGK